MYKTFSRKPQFNHPAVELMYHFLTDGKKYIEFHDHKNSFDLKELSKPQNSIPSESTPILSITEVSCIFQIIRILYLCILIS